MKCADIMNRNLEWLTETDTIARAANVMAEAGVGFLPICDRRGHVIGVVTDRDLTVRALAKQVAPAATSAAMVMSAPALTCLDSADVRDAEQLMANERKARLAIVDASGKLVGILSLADLVEHAPQREAVTTLQAVLWREALGPRAGAVRGAPLLKDDVAARTLPIPADGATVRPSVFTGGSRETGTKEFPG